MIGPNTLRLQGVQNLTAAFAFISGEVLLEKLQSFDSPSTSTATIATVGLLTTSLPHSFTCTNALLTKRATFLRIAASMYFSFARVLLVPFTTDSSGKNHFLFRRTREWSSHKLIHLNDFPLARIQRKLSDSLIRNTRFVCLKCDNDEIYLH